jgi:photosystem II stability/assembly factor-like uncharacterized protein
MSATPGLAQFRGRFGPPPGFRFRFLGPAVGNRIASAAGIPGDPTTYYAGAASGGVWKSSDGGQRWTPIFDNEPVAAIGALAVSAADHNIVWAGTGEAWAIRDSDLMGDGVYKSTDAGKTWTHMGLTETGRIGRIVTHPTNPDIAYVCALGRTTGPQQERGVFRTTDGGKNWQRVLFVNPNTGCSGLAMDPHDPNVLYAGTWQVVMHTWGLFSGGPGSGVFVSHDAGTTWTRIEGHGLPHSPVGKIDVAVAPSNTKRLYALIETAHQGSVWRSDDGGENWQRVSWARPLIGRAGYYIRLAVSPTNENEVLVANSSVWESEDGGKTFRVVRWGGDTHDIWIDPTDANRIVVTDDGGMYITTDHGKTSHRVSLPIGQMYHVAVDNDVPYHIYTNMQDDGTMRGLSTEREVGGGRGEASNWDHELGGCESGFTLPDLTDTNIIWASCYGDEVTRYDYRLKTARSVSPWMHTLDSEPNKAKYRCHWTPPLAIDPFDHNTVYYGCQVIFRTNDGGTSWKVISPDLSTHDPSRIVSSGGLIGDNLGQFYGEVVFSIAPSPVEKGLIWAGTNDGKVWYTRDAGAHWVDVTANISGMPAWGTVSKIEPSHFDPGTAYIAVDFHLMDNRDPWLYKTTDYGRTWTKISGDLPHGPLAYARVIAEDPNDKGLLFAGTGNALYYSTNGGEHWTQLKDGLPPAAVSWVVVQKTFHDLVVSTYGRGVYILDDITPLEQGGPDTGGAVAKLWTPRPTYRLLHRPSAILDYSLAEASKEPVKFEILDSRGTVIRHLEARRTRAGLNRLYWDMRYDPPTLIALRTTPPDDPGIWEEPRFHGQDTRPVTHWGIDEAEVGPIVAPGTYTVRMSAGGQTYEQPIHILRDPSTPSSDRDLESSVRLQLKVRNDITAVSDMVNQIEWMRRQLEDQHKTAADKEALLQKIDAIDRKLQQVEYELISKANTYSDDKFYMTAYKLYLNFIWLNGEIGTGAGDVAGNGGYPPTETSIGLVYDLENQLKAAQADYRNLMSHDVPEYNRSIEGSGLAPLKTTGAPPPPPPRRFGFGGN